MRQTLKEQDKIQRVSVGDRRCSKNDCANKNDGSIAAVGIVPQETELSCHDLEDKAYDSKSTDNEIVKEKQIVDLCGKNGIYTGQISKSTGLPHGNGRLDYDKKGSWYEGDWVYGRWKGRGRYCNGLGDTYEGDVNDDCKHGMGIMKFADGRVFAGEYMVGQMVHGKMVYQNGSIYVGPWLNGMRHGVGKCMFWDGSEYEGEFEEDCYHGRGKMTWSNGEWYTNLFYRGKERNTQSRKFARQHHHQANTVRRPSQFIEINVPKNQFRNTLRKVQTQTHEGKNTAFQANTVTTAAATSHRNDASYNGTTSGSRAAPARLLVFKPQEYLQIREEFQEQMSALSYVDQYNCDTDNLYS